MDRREAVVDRDVSLDDGLTDMSVSFMCSIVRKRAIAEILAEWDKIVTPKQAELDPLRKSLVDFFSTSPFGCQASQAREMISLVVGYDVCDPEKIDIKLGYLMYLPESLSKDGYGWGVIPALSLTTENNIVQAKFGNDLRSGDVFTVKCKALRYATVAEVEEYLASAPTSTILQTHLFLCQGCI